MSDKEEANSCNFDDIFSGSQKPSISLDCSYLDDDAEFVCNKVTIDYDEDDQTEYTVRKFSTSKSRKKVIDEGEERRRSPSRKTAHPPLFYTAFLGSTSTGKTSLCTQFKTSTMICLHEVKKMINEETEIEVEVDQWKCRWFFIPISFPPQIRKKNKNSRTGFKYPSL